MDINKGLKVLSLFDGIGCGYAALNRAGISIDTYIAYEIDNNAIRICQHNHPDVVECGDVTTADFTQYRGFDLVIGGSPCQGFSNAGYGLNFNDPRSKLYFEFERALQEVRPKYFLLENVVMKKAWSDIISQRLHTHPIEINSNLVSAQNRRRLYWTNIPIHTLPEDKGVVLSDVLIQDGSYENCGNAKTVIRALPKLQAKYGYVPKMFNAYNVSEITDKSPTLSTGSMVTSSCATTIFVEDDKDAYLVDNGVLYYNGQSYTTKLPNGKYILRKLSPTECERLQTLPDGYTAVEGLSDSMRYKAIGNGWTVDVISYIFNHIPK